MSSSVRFLQGLGLATGGVAMGVAVATSWMNDKGALRDLSEHQGELTRKLVVRQLGQSGPQQPQQQPPRPWDYNWDGRNPESLVKPLKQKFINNEEQIAARAEKVAQMQPKVNKRVILIRHGQYNLKGTSDEERYLTDIGREQAKCTGQRLNALLKQMEEKTAKDENGNHIPLKVRFVRSTMTRATETANIILEQLSDDVKSRLLTKDSPVNCDLIREGAPVKPVPESYLWKPDENEFFQEGAVIEAGFRAHFQRPDPEETSEVVDVLVCHGNVIRYSVCRALQFSPDAWLRFGVKNASITIINLRPSGRVSVAGIGEAGHLSKDLVTSN